MKDDLGAFVPHTEVRLEGAPGGALAGLTFAAKDLFDVAGLVSGCGNPDWLRTHEPATATASTIVALVDAGATMIGKTVTDELAYSLAGQNHHYGTPLNSAAPDRIPGGSSSGSAAAVAGGLVDFALGSDTGGSVRVPASFCGVYGLRTSHGRVPVDGLMPLAPIFDTVGWFAREAGLMARVGEVLVGARGAELPGRLLLAEDAFAVLDEEGAAALAPAVEQIAGVLGAPARVTVSRSGLAEWVDPFRRLQAHQIWRAHGAWLAAVKPVFGPAIRDRFAWIPTVGDGDIAAALVLQTEVAARLDDLLADDAVLCLPSTPDIAPLKTASPAEMDAFRNAALSLTCLAGFARLPQLSMPLGDKSGVPLGISLIGPRGSDESLLAVAQAVST